jgi:hypothetical protein
MWRVRADEGLPRPLHKIFPKLSIPTYVGTLGGAESLFLTSKDIAIIFLSVGER